MAIIIGYYIERVIRGEITMAKWVYWLCMIVSTLISVAIPIGLFFGLPQEPVLAGDENLAWYFLLLPVGVAVSWILFVKNKKHYAIVSWASSWIITILIFFYVVFPVVDKKNPINRSSYLLTSAHVAYYGSFNPAYVFFLKKPIARLSDPTEVETFFQQHKEGVLITQRRFLMDLNPFSTEVFSQKDLFENNETVILKRKEVGPPVLNP
jgi:hypothetical protein